MRRFPSTLVYDFFTAVSLFNDTFLGVCQVIEIEMCCTFIRISEQDLGHMSLSKDSSMSPKRPISAFAVDPPD